MQGHGRKMARSKPDASDLDPGIRDAVLLLCKAGFKTFTSCEGGRGHGFRHETIGLELDGDYHSFHKRLVECLRSQGMENFTVSLVTDYPKGKSYVYLEGLDLLSAEKRRRVVESVKRRERTLRSQMRKLGVSE
jgi:hypothetical protein